MGRILVYDVRTKKTKILEKPIEVPKEEEIKEAKINLFEVKKLIDYAKKQGWI